MIRKTEHERKMFVKSWVKSDRGTRIEQHIENHLVTTYWFLFIPVFRVIKIISSNI